LTRNYNQEPKSTDYQQKFKYQQKYQQAPKNQQIYQQKCFTKKQSTKKSTDPLTINRFVDKMHKTATLLLMTTLTENNICDFLRKSKIKTYNILNYRTIFLVSVLEKCT